MPEPVLVAGLVAAGYLLGSIPFGIVVSRSLGGPDPRSTGSQNIGFTNVLRVSGTLAGVLTLAGDAGKGWVTAWVGRSLVDDEAGQLVVALAPIVGHMFPVFLGFRGGKGVATALGSIAGLAPWVGVSLLGIWLVTVALWRYSSAGAVSAFVAFPLVAAGFGRSWLFLAFALGVSAVILVRHKGNILRLYQGIEPRMGTKTS